MRLRGSPVTLLARVVRLEAEHVSLSIVAYGHHHDDAERYPRSIVEWRYPVEPDPPGITYTGPTLAPSPEKLLRDAVAGAHEQPKPDRQRVAAGDVDPDPTPRGPHG